MTNIKRDIKNWPSFSSEREIEYLREMLLEGWELISVCITPNNYVYYWSK